MQIVDWLGADGGECLIVLDECHKAKNLVDDSGTSEYISVSSLDTYFVSTAVLVVG